MTNSSLQDSKPKSQGETFTDGKEGRDCLHPRGDPREPSRSGPTSCTGTLKESSVDRLSINGVASVAAGGRTKTVVASHDVFRGSNSGLGIGVCVSSVLLDVDHAASCLRG